MPFSIPLAYTIAATDEELVVVPGRPEQQTVGAALRSITINVSAPRMDAVMDAVMVYDPHDGMEFLDNSSDPSAPQRQRISLTNAIREYTVNEGYPETNEKGEPTGNTVGADTPEVVEMKAQAMQCVGMVYTGLVGLAAIEAKKRKLYDKWS